MGAEARLSCVYIQQGSESGHVPILPCLPPPLPSSSPSLPPSLPPSLCWPAPLRASQGRFLPQLGVLGCVAACLYWSVDFLVAACTYLNIPPAAALCSRPYTAPPPPSSLSPPSSLCSVSHPLFDFITPSTRVLLSSPLAVQFSSFPSGPFFLFLISCFPSSPCLLFLVVLLFPHNSVSLALSPLSLSSCRREKKQDRLSYGSTLQSTLSFTLHIHFCLLFLFTFCFHSLFIVILLLRHPVVFSK